MLALLNFIFIVTIIVCLITIYNMYLAKKSVIITDYKKIKNRLKTGDLVLFASYNNGYENSIQRMYTGTFFNHVGVIYKDKKGVLYVVETYPKNLKNKNGGRVYINNLDEEIQKYNGDLFIRYLLKSVEKKNLDIFEKKINELQKYKFPNNKEIVRKLIYNCYLNYKLKNNMHCAELVGYILSDILKIYQFKNKSCLTPYHFSKCPHYSKIYKIS